MGAEAGRSLWQVLLGTFFSIRVLSSENLQYFPSAPEVKSKLLIHTDPAPGKAGVKSV